MVYFPHQPCKSVYCYHPDVFDHLHMVDHGHEDARGYFNSLCMCCVPNMLYLSQTCFCSALFSHGSNEYQLTWHVLYTTKSAQVGEASENKVGGKNVK